MEWLACGDPHVMTDFLAGAATERKLRLLAVAFCRRLWPMAVWDDWRDAVLTAERAADGVVTAAELQALRDATFQAYATEMTRPRRGALMVAAQVADRRDTAFVDRTAAGARAMAARASGGPDRDAAVLDAEAQAQADLARDIFGNPFRSVAFSAEWRTSTAVALAAQMYEGRDFSAMPILADALQDAGCDNEDVLDHCRGPGPHVRGCWVVDLVLEKS